MTRLHPRIRLLWLLRAAVLALIVGGGVALAFRFTPITLPVSSVVVSVGLGAVVLVVGVTSAVLRYRAWQYEIRDDSLYLERGVLTKVTTVVPFVRIQHVDTRRSPIERAIGLASTIVYTAGSRGADVSVPGLEIENADGLQDKLKRLAIRAEADDAV